VTGVAIEVQLMQARCIATGACVRAAMQTFALDDGQVARIIDPHGDPEEAVVAAAEACPTAAIWVLKDGVRIA
jgi:ferredoxin